MLLFFFSVILLRGLITGIVDLLFELRFVKKDLKRLSSQCLLSCVWGQSGAFKQRMTTNIMRMTPMIYRLGAAMLPTLLITGCATVLQGTSDELTVVVEGGERSSTVCTLTDGRSEQKELLLGVPVSIARTSRDLNIRCEDGALTVEHDVRSSFSSAWLLADFLMDFCIITCPVDLATGAFYDYPDKVVVSFDGETQRSKGVAQ